MRARSVAHGWGECSCGTFHAGPTEVVRLAPDDSEGYCCPDDGYGMPREGLELDGPAWQCGECGCVYADEFSAARCCTPATRLVR